MSEEATRLGRTGLMVSQLCLGTMTFGLQSGEEEAVRILDRAFDAGIYFLDTADVYPLGGGVRLAGTTEEIIGRWLKGKRDKVVLATKCFGATAKEPFQQGNSRKHIFDAVDASLRRLGTDYIDLYQLHRYDPNTPIDETMSALGDLVHMGKVRYIGCSNYPAFRLAKANGLAEGRGWERFSSVQPRYNLLYRVVERDLLELAREDGIGVIPYNPIAGGLLSGKHNPNQTPAEGTRFNSTPASQLYRERYWHEELFATVEQLKGVALREGVSLVTLAVAWVMRQPGVSAPIIGASKAVQLDESLAALNYQVSDELDAELRSLTDRYLEGPSLI
ncbi:aldo/keto reductase [Ferrimicrobium sp.]|uniref:aldo/keto reductase n=1 Tax=Ferrimicrobium sp. TaxID=2926050 RepID=UPI0034509311|nr:aldo/keto reductase [Actinomycetota bacterium]